MDKIFKTYCLTENQLIKVFVNDSRRKLFILSGLPGSGKTTFRRKLVNACSWLSSICPDDIRAEISDINDQSRNKEVFGIAYSRLDLYGSEGRDIIWDATNLRRSYREDIAKRPSVKGYTVIEIMFNVDVDTALKRNNERDRKVREEVIRRMDATDPNEKNLELDDFYDILVKVDSEGHCILYGRV